jgi:hypothetical protein
VITIVSGLPRSGTSLMMQMLAAGGMPVLTDGERKPDEDNPRGYYEWETIKLLPKQPEYIDAAEGKAVKVISQLLFALPGEHDYRILFVERPLAEVLASQSVMIARRGSSGGQLGAAQMEVALQAHLNQVKGWLQCKQRMATLFIRYSAVIDEPRSVAEAVRNFLQCDLAVENMAAQVTPALYRQRK